MRSRLRVTGFTRFFIVMLFIVPLAYMGAAYYNGEDGLQNLKNLLGIGKQKANTEARQKDTGSASGFKNITGTDLQQLKARVEALEKENRELKVKIRDLDLELKATKLQLDRAKSGGR